MKETGVVRKLDELGRVVIPIEIRKQFNYNEGDKIEIYIENDNVVLRKVESYCAFCGKTEDLREFKDKNICKECLKKIQKM